MTGRRSFLKQLAGGTACLAGGWPFLRSQDPAPSPRAGSSRVIFRTGSERRALIRDTLAPLESDVKASIGRRRIVIKPNFVTSRTQACASHVDAARGVLDVLKRITDRPIIIAESPASGDAARCFDVYGFNVLQTEYKVQLMDLNAQPTIEVGKILLRDGSTTQVRLIKMLVDKNNYVISLAKPKTHDTVVATLTTKNVIMAAPLRLPGGEPSDKRKMHGGRVAAEDGEYLTKNMFALADLLLPDLAVLDGFEGMEGNGPVSGTAVDHRIALASTDSIAVDAIGIRLMGLDPKYLPYLAWCGAAGFGTYDRDRIRIDGPDPGRFVKSYKLPETYPTQIRWMEKADGSPTSDFSGRPSPDPLFNRDSDRDYGE